MKKLKDELEKRTYSQENLMLSKLELEKRRAEEDKNAAINELEA